MRSRLERRQYRAFVPCGVLLLWFCAVGISMSMPGQMRVFVPAAPSIARFVSRAT